MKIKSSNAFSPRANSEVEDYALLLYQMEYKSEHSRVHTACILHMFIVLQQLILWRVFESLFPLHLCVLSQLSISQIIALKQSHRSMHLICIPTTLNCKQNRDKLVVPFTQRRLLELVRWVQKAESFLQKETTCTSQQIHENYFLRFPTADFALLWFKLQLFRKNSSQ